MGTNAFKNDMFRNCTSLTEIDFSKATGRTIQSNSIFGTQCTKALLASANTTEAVSASARSTVKGMDKLTNLTVINDWAFKNCPSLTTINLSKLSALTRIDNNVFEGTALTTVDLTSSVNLTSIGNNAFANASSLATVTMPNFASNLHLLHPLQLFTISLVLLRVPKHSFLPSMTQMRPRLQSGITKIKFSTGQTRAAAEPNTFTFDGNSKATIILDNWVFDSCKKLTEATLAGNFEAKNGNAIQGTFQHATSLTKIDLRQMTGNPNIFNAANNFNDTGVIKTIVLDNTSAIIYI